MNIKQEYVDRRNGNEHINFTYVGGFEGVIFTAANHTVIFQKGNTAVEFHISEIAELIPYFEKWSKL